MLLRNLAADERRSLRAIAYSADANRICFSGQEGKGERCQDSQLGRIEHVVVLMLENRSFDNLLGWLYDPANAAPFNQMPPANFEGVYGKDLSNPTTGGQIIRVGMCNDVTAPFPDPGEPFQDVYAQIYGQKSTVAANAVINEPSRPCNMQGIRLQLRTKKPGKSSERSDHHELLHACEGSRHIELGALLRRMRSLVLFGSFADSV